MKEKYTKPEVKDYGTLQELTAAVDFQGPEDSTNKLTVHHS